MPHTPTTRKSWFPHPERDLHDNPFTEAACPRPQHDTTKKDNRKAAAA